MNCRCPGVENVSLFDCVFCFTQHMYEQSEAVMLLPALPFGWTPQVAMAHVLYWRDRVSSLTARRGSGPRDVAALFDT